MNIAFIQAGGTIDKGYPETGGTHGYNFEIANPAYEAMLEKFKPKFSFSSSSAVKKDSLDLTDEDRDLIYNAVEACEQEKVVITHGTDTIKKTAEKLSTIENKTIVLTGAMLPADFNDSDAEFNVGIAIGAAQSIESPGVYIALFGTVVPWDQFVNA